MSYVEQLREELVAAAAREQAHTRRRVQLPPLRPMALATAGLALTAILVIAIAGGLSTDRACDERPVKPPALEGRPLFGGTLFPGERYRTREFAPPLSFVVTDDNWRRNRRDAGGRAGRHPGHPRWTGPARVAFDARLPADPRALRPRCARSAGRARPAPANLHAWLEAASRPAGLDARSR